MNSIKYYTGVGSRKTPVEICNIMTEIGYKLEQKKFKLRSGRAVRADQAFEKKVRYKDIYTIENFDYSRKNYNFCKNEILSVLDPGIDFDTFYSKYSQTLILRDVNQVVGVYPNLVHSKFLICWTKHENYYDKGLGGTRFAVRIALKYNIPVFNLVNKDHLNRIQKWLKFTSK